MVKKTIDELTDGEETRLADAVIPFQVPGGATLKASIRPNPDIQINVRNEAQLEASILGTNLIIPAGTNVAVSYDKSFTQTKPFRIGAGATLEVFAPNQETEVTFDNPGTVMFQPENPGDIIRALIIDNLQIASQNGTEILMDGLVGTSRLFIDNTRVTDFASLGQITFPFVRINSIAPVDIAAGFILKEVTTLIMRASLMRRTTGTGGATLISIITNGVPITVLVDDSLTSILAADDKLFYLDQDSPTGTTYSIKDTPFSNTGEFYQTGIDATVDVISAGIAGTFRVDTTITHNLFVGQVVNNEGFGDNEYNGTKIVRSIFSPTQVDLDGVFTSTGTGELDANSLDSTSILVSARDNSNVPNSESHAETNTTRTLTVTGGTTGDEVPIQDLASLATDWALDPNSEEFIVIGTNGSIIYLGIKSQTYLIQYQLTAEKDGGPDQEVSFDIHVDGVPQAKSTIQVLVPATPGIPVTYIGGLFLLNNADNIQLFKTNTTNNSNTFVSVARVLITKA